MLRNPRGATSLRWLRALLDHGIEVRGQIVVCPGVNDGAVLDDTLAGVLDEYPELASVAVVPLGRLAVQPRGRRCARTRSAEAAAVVDTVEDWQDVFRAALGRRLVYAADEYYLMAGRPFPAAERYDGFPMHEDGIGMARTFELEFARRGRRRRPARGAASSPPSTPPTPRRTRPPTPGCAPHAGRRRPVTLRPAPRRAPIGVLTGELGARVLAPLVDALGRDDVRVIPVAQRVLRRQHRRHRADGRRRPRPRARRRAATATATCCPTSACPTTAASSTALTVADLPRPVEVVATDGRALRRALEAAMSGVTEQLPVGRRSSAGPTSARARCSTASSASRRRSSRTGPASPATARSSRPSGSASRSG